MKENINLYKKDQSKPVTSACSDSTNTVREAFGENLKELRNKKGLTVRELADISNLSKSTINNIELGRFSCSLDVQYSISKGLGIHIRDLFNFDL